MAGNEELKWKIQNGDLEELRSIVDQGKGDATANTEINGRYPLHYAADYGQKDVIAYLLEKGANINQQDKYGITPLLSAIFEGHKDCVAFLLSKGADKTGKSPSGESYMDSAESEEIKQLLK